VQRCCYRGTAPYYMRLCNTLVFWALRVPAQFRYRFMHFLCHFLTIIIVVVFLVASYAHPNRRETHLSLLPLAY